MDRDGPAGPYYLSSLDSVRFAPVRRVKVRRTLELTGGRDVLVTDVDPPVAGKDFGRDDIRTLVLAARHKGATVSPVNEFPCYVYIALPPAGWNPDTGALSPDDLQIIAWGELYRTQEDAQAQVGV